MQVNYTHTYNIAHDHVYAQMQRERGGERGRKGEGGEREGYTDSEPLSDQRVSVTNYNSLK